MNKNIIRTTGKFITTPVDNKINLWHVMDLMKLQTFLDGKLWLARLDQFKTDYEGNLPEANIGLLNMLLGNQSLTVQTKYEDIAQKVYASCWHMSNNNPADEMWNNFGGTVAIRTSPSIMQELVHSISVPEDSGPAYFGKVNYIKYSSDMVNDTNMLYASFAVDDIYANSEQEARFLISTDAISMDHYVHKCINKSKEAILLPINPKSFIEEIIIHESLSKSESDQIIQAIYIKGLSNKIKIS